MSRAQVLNDNLPEGFCPTSYQDLLNNFSQRQYINLEDDVSQLIVSATKPTETDKAWLQLDQFGRPVRIYWFAQGAWLSLHPQAPGFVMPWFDDVPDFTTFDGGDALAASPISGPMWERITDADIQARFPLTTGTLPSGTVVAQGDTGGEEEHELALDEMPEHTHDVTAPGRQEPNTNTSWEKGSGADETVVSQPAGGDANGDTVPHNNMPPYVGMCWLRRTSRMFYTVA